MPGAALRSRPRTALVALLLLFTALLGVVPSSQAAAPPAGRPVSAGLLSTPAPVTISGLDLHDGQLLKVGSTYELLGTMYGCGFSWYTPGTNWCGFGVSTAPAMSGPWSAPQLLFPPSAPDPYNPGHTYVQTCGSTGQGCFSPRMIQRTGWGPSDGVWILWFNAPWYVSGGAQSAYIAMGCNSATGPCGATAGAPYGTTHRPNLTQCSGANGDAGLSASPDGGPPALFCPMPGAASVSIERLSYWGADGSGTGSTHVAGLTGVEAMGAWRDSSTGTWVMTFSDPGCGYCTGTSAGYATAPALMGPWTAPANVGAGAPANGRRTWSSNSCGGQVDTVSVIDGVPWQKLDLWTGSPAEPSAGLHFEPLTYTPATGSTGDGQLWRPALAPLTCN